MSLQEQGFRFIRRGVEFKWEHLALLRSDDLDCTDMTDEEFEKAVAEVQPARAVATGAAQ